MNKIPYTLTNNQIKFDRFFLIQLIKGYIGTNISYQEKQFLIAAIINKVEIFEKKLSENFQLYLRYETDVDNDYIDYIIQQLQLRLKNFINTCLQQEYKHLIL